MKKKYEKPKMEIFKTDQRSPLLADSIEGLDRDYTAGFNHELGGEEDFQ